MSMTSLAAMTIASMATMQTANEISNPTGVIYSFDIDTISGIIGEMGWGNKRQSIKASSESLNVTSTNGISFTMTPSACSSARKCSGLLILAPFPGTDDQFIFDFNNQRPFIKASSYGRRGSYVSRYEIADGGYVRNNLRAVLINFANRAGEYRVNMSSYMSSNDPDVEFADFTADSLNRENAAKIKSEKVNFGDVYGSDHGHFGNALESAFDTISVPSANGNETDADPK